MRRVAMFELAKRSSAVPWIVPEDLINVEDAFISFGPWYDSPLMLLSWHEFQHLHQCSGRPAAMAQGPETKLFHVWPLPDNNYKLTIQYVAFDKESKMCGDISGLSENWFRGVPRKAVELLVAFEDKVRVPWHREDEAKQLAWLIECHYIKLEKQIGADFVLDISKKGHELLDQWKESHRQAKQAKKPSTMKVAFHQGKSGSGQIQEIDIPSYADKITIELK